MTTSEAAEREALLPCPFCGGKGHVYDPKGNPAHESWVSCQSCRASSCFRNNEEAAIAAWNMRAQQAQQSQLNNNIAETLQSKPQPDDVVEQLVEIGQQAIINLGPSYSHNPNLSRAVVNALLSSGHVVLKQEVEELVGYAVHDDDCQVNVWMEGTSKHRCTCGYDVALSRFQPVKEED